MDLAAWWYSPAVQDFFWTFINPNMGTVAVALFTVGLEVQRRYYAWREKKAQRELQSQLQRQAICAICQQRLRRIVGKG